MKGVRTYLFLGLLLLLAVVILASSVGQNTYIAKKNPLDSLILQKTAEDRDGDGLKDWEEALWKTSLENPDTDGDGVSDGEEVDKGRDPKVAGPDDVIQNFSQNIAGGEALTATDKLARDLFSLYAAKKQLGEKVTEADQKALIESFFAGSGTIPNTLIYTTEDIKIVQGIDNKTYAEAVGDILVKEGNVMSTNDAIELVKKAIETEDRKELKKLDTLALAYQKITGKLLLLPTSPQTADLHLSLINSFESLFEDILAIQGIFDDSLRGLVYLRRYADISVPNASKFSREVFSLISP